VAAGAESAPVSSSHQADGTNDHEETPPMPRFMLFMLPGIAPEEYSEGPSLEAVEAMNRFNQDLVDAGALLAADGLHPAERGRRVSVQDGSTTVTDGPFGEAKEVVGGYWIIQARDLHEATKWATRVPIGPGPQVEVREIGEVSDMPEDVQAAVKLTEEPPDQTVAG